MLRSTEHSTWYGASGNRRYCYCSCRVIIVSRDLGKPVSGGAEVKRTEEAGAGVMREPERSSVRLSQGAGREGLLWG